MRMCILACEIPCSNPRGVGVVVRIVGHDCDVKLRGPPYSEAQVTYVFTDYWFVGGYLAHTEWRGQYLALSAPTRSGNFHLVRPGLDKFGDVDHLALSSQKRSQIIDTSLSDMKLLLRLLALGTTTIDTLVQGLQILINTSKPSPRTSIQGIVMKTQVGQLLVDPSRHLSLRIDHTSMICVNPPDLQQTSNQPMS